MVRVDTRVVQDTRQVMSEKRNFLSGSNAPECWLHAPHLIRMTRFQNSPRFGKNDVMSWNVSNCMRSCVAKDTTLGKRGSFRPDECRILNPLSSQRVNFESVSRPASESLNGVHIHVPNEIGRKTGEEGHGRYCASSI